MGLAAYTGPKSWLDPGLQAAILRGGPKAGSGETGLRTANTD